MKTDVKTPWFDDIYTQYIVWGNAHSRLSVCYFLHYAPTIVDELNCPLPSGTDGRRRRGMGRQPGRHAPGSGQCHAQSGVEIYIYTSRHRAATTKDWVSPCWTFSRLHQARNESVAGARLAGSLRYVVHSVNVIVSGWPCWRCGLSVTNHGV